MRPAALTTLAAAAAAAALWWLPPASAFVVVPPPSSRCPRSPVTVVRHFTVGGEAPDGPTLAETINQATGIAALVVGVLVAREVASELPTGWVNEQLVESGPSTLGPQAGRGLFAFTDIPKDTVIGEYPGLRFPKAAWLSRKEGEAGVVLASRYTWTLANGDVLDPTLPSGELPKVLTALGGLVKKPTLLALINEPPVGVDINVLPEVTDTAVTFRAERDIYAGEELWVDYGPMYDRRSYKRR